MRGGDLSRAVARLAVLLWALAAFHGAALARPAAPPPDSPAQHDFCIAYDEGRLPTTIELVQRARFDCSLNDLNIAAPRAILRFDIDHGKPLASVFVSHRSQIDALRLYAVDANGWTRLRDVPAIDLEPAHTDGFFKARLPRVTEQTRTVYAVIEKPTHTMTLSRAHISPGDPGFGERGRQQLVYLAALCGMLVMPLLFNLAFYRVLRERFVLWHSALSMSLMATILLESGLSNYLVALDVPTLNVLTTLVFGISVATAGMFAQAFIEPGYMKPFIRRALPWAAGWAILLSSTHAFFPFVLRAWQTQAYYILYLPVLALYCWLLVDALRRGSRAAKYQIVGWGPLLAVGIIRQLGQLTPLIEPTEAMGLFYLGAAFEVLATTLGVADRFMAIKQQRDVARNEASVLERISECDALTGLLNRRALEDRFDLLRAEGFTTLAVLDLDRFKSINDEYGHGIGDEVLKAAAQALRPDPSSLAFRIGGEEFVLLLKGGNSLAAAERRRQAITALVARMVDGLERPVTASMGLVEVPPAAVPDADFQQLYTRADKLLYEAKQAGRNRTISERVQLFVPRAKERRRAA